MCKLDRIMVNQAWISEFVDSEATFLPTDISDHSPALLQISHPQNAGRSFKFFNKWLKHPEFMDIVQSTWTIRVLDRHGREPTPMLRAVLKLKALKNKLKTWSKNTHNIQKTAISQTRQQLQHIQQAIQQQPHDENLHKQEYTLKAQLAQLLQEEESDLRQQARISWLNLGDSNNSFFYKARNARRNRNAIMSIYSDNGELLTGYQVQEEAVKYFKSLLAPQTQSPNLSHMQTFRGLSQQSKDWLSRPVTPNEIEEVVMSSKNDKAPGTDGFNAEFYKACWPIIKRDITEAIISFFRSGKMLGELNITSITLVAKKKNPNTFQDYRPISVCKVLYRFISKIIANRLTHVLKDVASLNQHAFIKDRKIHENIALCHELLHNYHKGKGPPRMAIKIDIHKAYDSLNWNFLTHLLHLLGFPPVFYAWIRACITKPSFTINMNGNSVEYFSSTRGLR